MTYDMDAIIHSSSAMRDAITVVGDKLGLPYGWLNTDFMNTISFTPRLTRYSKYYKTFSNILQIRTISAEYLIAMKLMAGRPYKNDLSDIVGIMIEQSDRGDALSLERVKAAIVDLYDDYERVPKNSRDFIEALFNKTDLHAFYTQCREMELENKDILVGFQGDYPGVLDEDNMVVILEAAKKKRKEKTIKE